MLCNLRPSNAAAVVLGYNDAVHQPTQFQQNRAMYLIQHIFVQHIFPSSFQGAES